MQLLALPVFKQGNLNQCRSWAHLHPEYKTKKHESLSHKPQVRLYHKSAEGEEINSFKTGAALEDEEAKITPQS